MASVDAIYASLESRIVPGVIAILAAVVAYLGLFQLSKHDGPPPIPDTIPFVTNTYLFLKNMKKFISRASATFGTGNVVTYNLGPKLVYLFRGQRNIQALLRPNHEFGSEGFMLMAKKNLWLMSETDLVKFEKDHSGRARIPAPGTESVPDSQRYWAGTHRLYDDYLSKAHYANCLAAKYYELFNQRLDTQPLNEWAQTHIYGFIKHHMGESAVVSLYGPKILELNPDFMAAFWEYDKVGVPLAWGLPRWLNRKAHRIRERYYGYTARWLEVAAQNFNLDAPDAEVDWEEHFGSRFARELSKWLRDGDFTAQTAAGFFASVILGLNSNTVPVTTWILIHIILDQELFHAVRAEALQAVIVDPATGVRTISLPKLVSLPLLQSIYTEVMRMKVSIAITRQVTSPVVFNGLSIAKGSFMQAMTDIPHFEEEVWGREGHPASEFWAVRHLVYTEERDEDGRKRIVPEFSLAGKTGAFFPFGGGTGICPGRFFAKQEILVSVAAVVTRFDIEFVEWTNIDGTKSDREALSDQRYAGTAAMPPDRDLKIRWKRLW
ncbi:cytochrome P450 [Podospora didyma]|uniref:Cytochrome P450 n=1 Tax=Podospora didyma TaxID=330526 RepID=A0AAE0K116_9PEZI|nr:cytochrome P450 [Podospora didyma]